VKLNVTFSETGYSGNISVDFSKSDNTFSTDFGQLQVVTDYVDPAERYEGEYTATPKVEAQTLPTAKKYLDKDITLLAIPYFETSNTSGGNTVYIAKEI